MQLPDDGSDEADWSYVMRREMQEILPGLYLGPYASAMKAKLENLQDHKITHIVCVRQDIESHFIRPNFPDLFEYLVLNIADSHTQNIIQYFPQVFDFIENCLEYGGNVLVHGNAGISRSATLVIAYVMKRYGLSFKCSFMYVQQKRFCVNPNEGFTRQLMEYEPIYRAQQALEGVEPTHTADNLKRKCQFDSEEGGDGEEQMVT